MIYSSVGLTKLVITNPKIVYLLLFLSRNFLAFSICKGNGNYGSFFCKFWYLNRVLKRSKQAANFGEKISGFVKTRFVETIWWADHKCNTKMTVIIPIEIPIDIINDFA